MPVRRTQSKSGGKITQWSFSRLSTYKTCPSQLKYQAIDRLKIAPNKAMQRGTDIHAMCEQYLRAEKTPKVLPDELSAFEVEFKDLRKMLKNPKRYKFYIEQKWAFDRNWVFLDDYFDSRVWVRVVIDLAVHDLKDNVLIIIDYKTGRPRPDHQDQLKLYGTAGFAWNPTLARVEAAMWYLDVGMINNEDDTYNAYVPTDMDVFIKFWEVETKPMLTDTTFRPKPSNLCSWCDFSKANGGPCKY